MSWLIWALACSVLMAVGIEINRFLQQDGVRLNFLKQLFMLIAVAPVVIFIPWPDALLQFWGAAAIVSIAIVVSQSIAFVLAARKQSRIAAMVGPVQFSLAFILWCFVSSDFRAFLADNPDRFFFIIPAIGFMGIAMASLRKCDTSWNSLHLVLPAAALCAVADIISKLVLIDLPPHFLIPCYIFACGVFAVPLLGSHILIKGRDLPHPFTSQALKAGALVGAIGIVQVIAFLMALIEAPNPAYVTACLMFVPVWILLWHKIRGENDVFPTRSLLFIVIGAILLLIPDFSQLIER